MNITQQLPSGLCIELFSEGLFCPSNEQSHFVDYYDLHTDDVSRAVDLCIEAIEEVPEKKEEVLRGLREINSLEVLMWLELHLWWRKTFHSKSKKM